MHGRQDFKPAGARGGERPSSACFPLPRPPAPPAVQLLGVRAEVLLGQPAAEGPVRGSAAASSAAASSAGASSAWGVTMEALRMLGQRVLGQETLAAAYRWAELAQTACRGARNWSVMPGSPTHCPHGPVPHRCCATAHSGNAPAAASGTIAPPPRAARALLVCRAAASMPRCGGSCWGTATPGTCTRLCL